MARCEKCGRISISHKCQFCLDEKGIHDAKLTLENMGCCSNDSLYVDTQFMKKQAIINHGIIVEGDVKIVHGDEISPGAKKIAIEDSIINRSVIGDTNTDYSDRCQHCGGSHGVEQECKY